ncbi:MAG: hypothetical protein QW059_06200 [Nitrososphaerota archaeon]
MRELIYWLELQRSQWYSRDKLLAIQSRRLRKLLDHAYRRVPFYRRLYGERLNYEADPSTILKELPPVDRWTLVNTPLSERTASNINLAKCLPRRAAGTTGEPVTILETKGSAAYWKALYLRRLWACGVRPGDKIMRTLPTIPAAGINFFSTGILKGLSRLNLRFINMSRSVEENVAMLLKFKPDVLIAQPSDLVTIERRCEQLGAEVAVKTILTTGEVLTPAVRRRFEQAFNATTYDSYSTVELGNIA